MAGYFEWDKDFLTGINTVDAQHYGLVEVINELLSLSFSNKTIEIEKILDLESKLTHYVVIHFDTENQLMEQYNIDSRHVMKHQLLHGDFIKTVKKYFVDKSELNNPHKLSEIIEYLVRWLAYHILNTDKSMARQMRFIEVDGLTPENAYNEDEKLTDSTSEPLLKALRALFYLVSEKNKELEVKNQELEDKVAQRTRELQDANSLLNQQSIHDELTGLHNRRYVMTELERLIYDYNRYEVMFSILFIDLNKFKVVNDTYGHDYGDAVLKWIAHFLKENTRKSDIACRMGGDEFVILCPHSDGEQAFILANKLVELTNTLPADNRLEFWEPSFSIGVAEFERSMKEPSDVLNKADASMYEAKKSGRCFAVLARD